MKPLVTICVMTWNRMATLPASLQKILDQDYAPLEIIICDNASSDGTEAFCRSVAASDPRVTYVRHPQNIGLHGNLNFSLGSGMGKYLCVFHDHDVHAPNIVSTYVEFMERHADVGLVCSNWELIDEQGNFLGARDQDVPAVMPGMEFIERTIRSGRSSIGIPGAMIRREALGAIRFVPDAPVGFGDFPVWFEIAETWSVGHVEGRLWKWAQSATSQSAGTVTSMATQFCDNVTRYCAAHLTRWPDHQAIVARWLRQMEEYRFWVLVYEVALYYRFQDAREHALPVDGSATRYEFLAYRLKPDELRGVLSQLRDSRRGFQQHAAWLALNLLIGLHVTWPLAWGVRHHARMRQILGLR